MLRVYAYVLRYKHYARETWLEILINENLIIRWINERDSTISSSKIAREFRNLEDETSKNEAKSNI